MLSVKQGGIKYHFLSLWYDSTWDWTQVSRAIGEHWVLSKEVSSIIFRVFGMTRPGIELKSPRLLANILTIRPMSRFSVI